MFGVSLLLLALSGCGPVNEVTQPGYLLNKNIIRIADKENIRGEKKLVSSRDLTGYIKQDPNKKFLGVIRLNTWIYKKASRGKERKYKTWFKEKLGQEPVMLDSSLILHSSRDMKLYLNNVGYFNSEMETDIIYKKKKANVEYIVTTNEPYIFRKIQYEVKDDALAKFVYADTLRSFIQSGAIYNSYKLDSERDRITRMLNDSGYYNFAKNYIQYQIDSNLNSRQMDIKVLVRNKQSISPDDPDSIIEQNHKRYLINTVIVNRDFNPRRALTHTRDTVVFLKVVKKNDTLGS